MRQGEKRFRADDACLCGRGRADPSTAPSLRNAWAERGRRFSAATSPSRFLRHGRRWLPFVLVLVVSGLCSLAAAPPAEVTRTLANVRSHLQDLRQELDELWRDRRTRQDREVDRIVERVREIEAQVGRIHASLVDLSITGPQQVKHRLEPVLTKVRSLRLRLTRRAEREKELWQSRRDIRRLLADVERQLQQPLPLTETRRSIQLPGR